MEAEHNDDYDDDDDNNNNKRHEGFCNSLITVRTILALKCWSELGVHSTRVKKVFINFTYHHSVIAFGIFQSHKTPDGNTINAIITKTIDKFEM